MNTHLVLAPALAAALLPAGALTAGESVKFGGSVQVNAPLGDLKTDLNNKVGYGVSFQVPMRMEGGLVVRPRLDANQFPVSSYERAGTEYKEEVKFDALGAGVDLLYYVDGRGDQGFYVMGGAGVQQWRLEYNTSDRTGNRHVYTFESTRNKTSAYGALGIGLQVNRWFGMELRGVYSKYDGPKGVTLGAKSTSTETRNATVVQLAATFKW